MNKKLLFHWAHITLTTSHPYHPSSLRMAIYFLSSQPLILLLLLSFSSTHLTVQSTSNNTSTGFSCSVDSPPSWEAYVAYFAQPPVFLDLGNISDLFQVSRVSVAESSNLASENIQLFQDQLLLVPITCGCTGNRYFANITYQLKQVTHSLMFQPIHMRT